MRHSLRILARAYARSIVQLALNVLGYIPSHGLRKLGLRCFGASIGREVLVHHGLWVWSPWKLEIGDKTIVGDRAILDARAGIKLGRNVNISSTVTIWTGQHDYQSPTFDYVAAPVSVGDNAWLSFRSIILPGVKIGEGAVVAAGAVVTKDVEPYTIVAGVPAKAIGKRTKDLRYDLGYGDGSYYRFI